MQFSELGDSSLLCRGTEESEKGGKSYGVEASRAQKDYDRLGGVRPIRIIAAEEIDDFPVDHGVVDDPAQVVKLSSRVSTLPGGPHAVFVSPVVLPTVEGPAYRVWEAEILQQHDDVARSCSSTTLLSGHILADRSAAQIVDHLSNIVKNVAVADILIPKFIECVREVFGIDGTRWSLTTTNPFWKDLLEPMDFPVAC